ncbi:peptidoglycan-binding domain-containing protein [Streptomyces sp. NPDC054933]|jgi:zinc D-Ala-D-Ala carboxypeptidase
MTKFILRATRGAAVLSATAAVLTGLATVPAHATAADYRAACYNEAGSVSVRNFNVPNVTLREGSTGTCVRELQSDLLGIFRLVDNADQANFVDGIFGPKTEEYVVKYQQQYPNRGGVDGVVGPETWHNLILSTTD